MASMSPSEGWIASASSHDQRSVGCFISCRWKCVSTKGIAGITAPRGRKDQLRRGLVTALREERNPNLSAHRHRYDWRVGDFGAAWSNEQALATIDEQRQL